MLCHSVIVMKKVPHAIKMAVVDSANFEWRLRRAQKRCLKEKFRLSSESTSIPIPPEIIKAQTTRFNVQLSWYPIKLFGNREKPALQNALTEWKIDKNRALCTLCPGRKQKNIKIIPSASMIQVNRATSLSMEEICRSLE